MVEGMELISNLITRYAIFEDLYLQRTSTVVDQLSQSLVNLYAAVLKYLSEARRYYSQNTASAFDVFSPQIDPFREADYFIKSGL